MDMIHNHTVGNPVSDMPPHIGFYFELENSLVTRDQLETWFPAFEFEPRYMTARDAREFVRGFGDSIERGSCSDLFFFEPEIGN